MLDWRSMANCRERRKERRESRGRFSLVARPQLLILSALLAGVLISPALAFENIRNIGDGPLAGPIPFHSLAASGVSKMDFVEDAVLGTLTITDSGAPVLSYRFGDQLKEGVDAKFKRSCYIHPLFSRDGQELTADFPADHIHHHGLFWGWPVVRVRGQTTNNWEVGSPTLRQHFVRWLKRDEEAGGAVLSVENAWKLGDAEVIAKEIVTIRVHPADSVGRVIDFGILITVIGGPLELQGTPDQNKGYGGLCFRSAPLLKGARMTTDKGTLNEDVVNTPFLWADISTAELGVAVFVGPGHPGAPVRWLIRNSYAGVINPSWPGLKAVKLVPGQPVELGYRIYVHRGDAAAGRVSQAYQRYLSAERPKNNP
jgi:hypothetical protein